MVELRSDDKVRKGEYEDAEILRLSELKKTSIKLPGLRSLKNLSDKLKLITPLIAWYEPGGHSGSHYHVKSEGIYFIHYIGQGVNKTRIIIGWPPEKAKITEVDEPTVVVIPPGVKHRFENIGTTVMMLVECYGPNWNTIGFDLVDSQKYPGRVFNNVEEYVAAYRSTEK